MMDNELGAPVPDFTPPPRPGRESLVGQYALLDRLNAAEHSPGLFKAFAGHDALWDYMPSGPFENETDYLAWAEAAEASEDPAFFTITDTRTGVPGGVASLLRIDPAAGSIEVGYITFGPALQRSPAATEAMFLLMQWAFKAGYRRYEWKCNALNIPSRRAAERLGLSYEGIFRQATVVKGRNRDTAWFAAIDQEWPALQVAFSTWLSPENFDADGRQRQSLSALTEPIRVTSDPALKPP